MARLDVEFLDKTCGFIAANEDIIERKISEKIDSGYYSELSACEYEQLSTKRKGILEWYSFREGAKLLELGAGMGALTELFAEKKCKVTCVEIKSSRAEIIKKRMQTKSNVNVICDNPVLYDTDELFDYIVVHDIWGYIRKYNKVDDAYNIFLSKIKKLLNPEGHLIIIADNRMALKYFSGSVDEYSRKLFVGLNKYTNYTYIRTFDKKELLDMMKKNDMQPKSVYYVNSDYYFAEKIYSDYALQHVKYVGKKFSTTYNAFSFFDEKLVYESLQNNGIVDKFVDAFIIDYCNGVDIQENFAYYQVGNKQRNGIAVFLDESKKFIKRELKKETGLYDEGQVISVEEFEKMILEHDIADDELKEYMKCNVKLPYVDPVEILNFGMKYSMCDAKGEDLQLLQEEKLIQQLIGELYEN